MKLFGYKQKQQHTRVWFIAIPWESERDDTQGKFVSEYMMDTVPRVGEKVLFGWFQGTVRMVWWIFERKGNVYRAQVYVEPNLDYEQTQVPRPVEQWRHARDRYD